MVGTADFQVLAQSCEVRHELASLAFLAGVLAQTSLLIAHVLQGIPQHEDAFRRGHTGLQLEGVVRPQIDGALHVLLHLLPSVVQVVLPAHEQTALTEQDARTEFVCSCVLLVLLQVFQNLLCLSIMGNPGARHAASPFCD